MDLRQAERRIRTVERRRIPIVRRSARIGAEALHPDKLESASVGRHHEVGDVQTAGIVEDEWIRDSLASDESPHDASRAGTSFRSPFEIGKQVWPADSCAQFRIEPR